MTVVIAAIAVVVIVIFQLEVMLIVVVVVVVLVVVTALMRVWACWWTHLPGVSRSLSLAFFCLSSLSGPLTLIPVPDFKKIKKSISVHRRVSATTCATFPSPVLLCVYPVLLFIFLYPLIASYRYLYLYLYLNLS